MTCDKLVPGITVTALAPTFGELVLMVLFEHLETVDVVQITRIDAIPDGRQWIPGSRCEAYEFSLNAHISSSGVKAACLLPLEGSSELLNDEQCAEASY